MAVPVRKRRFWPRLRRLPALRVRPAHPRPAGPARLPKPRPFGRALQTRFPFANALDARRDGLRPLGDPRGRSRPFYLFVYNLYLFIEKINFRRRDGFVPSGAPSAASKIHIRVGCCRNSRPPLGPPPWGPFGPPPPGVLFSARRLSARSARRIGAIFGQRVPALSSLESESLVCLL